MDKVFITDFFGGLLITVDFSKSPNYKNNSMRPFYFSKISQKYFLLGLPELHGTIVICTWKVIANPLLAVCYPV